MPVNWKDNGGPWDQAEFLDGVLQQLQKTLQEAGESERAEAIAKEREINQEKFLISQAERINNARR